MIRKNSQALDETIASLSTGGYGATVNGLRWHETFSHIGALSPGLMLGDILDDYDDTPAEDMTWAFGNDYYKGLHTLFGDFSKLRSSDRDYNGLIKRLKEESIHMKKIPTDMIGFSGIPSLKNSSIGFLWIKTQ